jgi:F0F1-type ATP synthase membrane subunit b/b'
MDLASRLQQLEDLVREAKSMPLSSSALVNREEVLELILEMKENLPEEVKQARWVVKDREELLGKARAEGERLVQEAKDEQLRMARKEEIVSRARAEAERIQSEAEEDGRRIRLEAEDYVDAKLAQFEIALRKIQEEAQSSTRQVARTLDQIELGRQKLRGAPVTEAEQRLGGHDDDGSPGEPPPVEAPREIDIEVEEVE